MNPPSETLWPPAPANLTLAPHQVEVWQTPTDLPLDLLTRWEAFLSAEERARIARLRLPAKRLEALVARGFLRTVLSRLLSVPPRDLAFHTHGHGKPFLPERWNRRRVGFNLSHTRGRILLAVAMDQDLGVDVECFRDNLDDEGLARRYFSPGEVSALLALPPDARRRAFFTCWTRKEALLKAVGKGIAAGLDTFEVSLDDPPLLRYAQDPAWLRWSLHTLPMPFPWVASLAVEGSATPFRCWTLPPE